MNLGLDVLEDSLGSILVVDDHEDTLSVLKDILERDGYVVFCASDGIQALEAFWRFRPDVLLLDLNMPKLSGFEVCAVLRGREDAEGVGILAISGLKSLQDKQRVFDAGFDGYLVKPLKLAELRRNVAALFPGSPDGTGA